MFNSVIMERVDEISGSNLKRKLMSAPVMHFNVDKGDIISETLLTRMVWCIQTKLVIIMFIVAKKLCS